MSEQRNEPSDAESRFKWEFGLWAVLMGVLAIIGCLLLVTLLWNDQTGLAALGVVVSPIAAIVSAYFGIQYSQKAASDAADVKQDAQRKVEEAQDTKAQAIRGLRDELLPKLQQAARQDSMSDLEAEGFAASAWKEASSKLPQ